MTFENTWPYLCLLAAAVAVAILLVKHGQGSVYLTLPTKAQAQDVAHKLQLDIRHVFDHKTPPPATPPTNAATILAGMAGPAADQYAAPVLDRRTGMMMAERIQPPGTLADAARYYQVGEEV